MQTLGAVVSGTAAGFIPVKLLGAAASVLAGNATKDLRQLNRDILGRQSLVLAPRHALDTLRHGT